MKISNKIIVCLIFCIPVSVSLKAQAWNKKQNAPVELTFPVIVSLDGEIHMIGGGAAAGATDLHLRYTISTDKWDTLAPVPYKAQQPAGAVVNGKIHFCGGGFPNTGTRLNKHYIYHSDKDTWTKAADLPVATAIHKAVSYNGQFYIMGGQPDKFMFRVYNPQNDLWTDLSSLPDQNFWYGGICASASGIYRFGGGGSGAPVAQAHHFDSTSNSWKSINPLPNPLHALSATAINDSIVFIAGGYGSGTVSKNCLIYNCKTGIYSQVNHLPEPRYYHSLIYENNCVFVLGGANDNDPDLGYTIWQNCIPTNSLELTHQTDGSQFYICRKPGGVSLNYSGNDAIDFQNYRIFDLYGRTIAEGQLLINETVIQVPSDGIYYFEFIYKGINYRYSVFNYR